MFIFATEFSATFLDYVLQEHGVFAPFDLALFFALADAAIDANQKLKTVKEWEKMEVSNEL